MYSIFDIIYTYIWFNIFFSPLQPNNYLLGADGSNTMISMTSNNNDNDDDDDDDHHHHHPPPPPHHPQTISENNPTLVCCNHLNPQVFPRHPPKKKQDLPGRDAAAFCP